MTLLPTSHPDPDERPRIGVCVVGGGIIGAVRSVAMLAGLEEAIADRCPEGLRLQVLVASRSGALAGGLLAGGERPRVMMDRLLDPGAEMFHPATRARLEVGNLLGFGRELARSLWHRGRRMLRDPIAALTRDEVRALFDSLPPGLLRMEQYEAALNQLFWEQKLPRYFDECKIALRFLAWSLDEGLPMALGAPGFDRMSIPRAIAAAATLPGLFAPTHVLGLDTVELPPGLVLHLGAACGAGAEALIVLSPSPPAVPGERDGKRSVAEHGLAAVWMQAQRQAAAQGLRLALKRHREHRPGVPVLLLQPRPPVPSAMLETAASAATREAAIREGFAVGRTAGAPGGAFDGLWRDRDGS